MLSLVVVILLSLEIAYFAIQNSAVVDLRFMNYQLTGLPIYFVAVVSLLVGVIVAWLISAMSSASHFIKLRNKDGIIEQDRKVIKDLKDKIAHLELEKTKLKDEDRQVIAETRHEEESVIVDRPSFVSRLFHPKVEAVNS